MADNFHHPVFFECHSPLEEQRRKIETYFSIRRRSGGGDCGPLKSVNDKVYSIAFRYKKDQKRVLQRSEHVVELKDGSLVLTVQGSMKLDTSTPDQDLTASAKDPHPIPASTPPPSGEAEAEDSTVKQRGSQSSEKQTSTHQLGEAKLSIMWKEIEHTLGRNFPGLKVTQGDVGQVVLEGSVEDILEAGRWISDKENLVLERTVSNMSPHILAFLRKTYGGQMVLGDILGVGEVEVELRDTELRLFSLSADKLDHAEKALQGEFEEVKIDVPDCSVLLSELLKKLTSKTSDMNRGQCRAQFFGSDSTVWLLGHTKEVRELSETVTQFILQSTVRLPSPELVHLLLEQLQLHNFDYSGVNFHPLTSSTGPMVVLEGPPDKVTEVRNRLGPFLDSLVQGRVNTDRSTGNSTLLMNAAAQDAAGAPGDGVQVEVVLGNIETQQVDALVSPMVGHKPLSTLVGNTLSRIAGSQLTARFTKEAGEVTVPGDVVLVEGLPGLPSKAVFFLSLAPWDKDQEGTPVEVLRLGINQILTSCDNRGFGSVAFPVLGAGIALRFPDTVIARVLLEEIHAFKQNRDSRTPFLVRITIHPDDTDSSEVFKGFTEALHQLDQVSTTKRIVLLGKTGSGKSSLANTIFGKEELFTTNDSPNSGTIECHAKTGPVNGRSITLIDTPGFFDANRSEEELKPEVVKCITECAPGPHAFLIVLKVDKFSKQEQDVIEKICQYFSEDALKYAVIVFTHGNQLSKGKKIQEFVSQNKNLSDLVKKCGGRCHVFDNKYWKNKQQNDYRGNRFQVEDLLKTIDKMVMENNGGYYTNKLLQEVEEEIKMEEACIKQSSGNMPQEMIRQQAKTNVSNRFLIHLAGTATGAVLGAFFGVAAMVGLVITAVRNSAFLKLMKSIPAVGKAATTAAAGGEGALVAAGVVGATTAVVAAAGGVMGGIIGHEAAQRAETPWEAAEMAANAVMEKAESSLTLK